jgi:hypothetical protein
LRKVNRFPDALRRNPKSKTSYLKAAGKFAGVLKGKLFVAANPKNKKSRVRSKLGNFALLRFFFLVKQIRAAPNPVVRCFLDCRGTFILRKLASLERSIPEALVPTTLLNLK